MKKIALVTGANRGIGFEIVKQLAKRGFEVILSSRDPHKGQAAVERLAKEGLQATYLPLDVSNPESIQALARAVTEKFGRLDILVNNAGILPDQSGKPTSPDTILNTFKTNSLGPYLMSEAFYPLMQKNGYGRIVNISSGMGQLSEMETGYPAYRISKTALNAVTRIFATKGEGSSIKVNSMCPGWVRTDMGGPGAERSTEEGAETAIWLATLPENGPNGGFFRDCEPIAW
jgi:NAD(P)-dependent dehydrogenase (short-subunit alcohol dehydrogenase family)